MRFRNQLLLAIQTMILLSGKKKMDLPKPKDVDVAEAHPEVVTVVSIVRETVVDIEVPTAIVEDSVEVTEVTEAASKASEVANEVESVVATAGVVNGGVITMRNVDEVEGVADEVIEQVVMDGLPQRLQLLHESSEVHYLPKI
jgi:hypothetical protein